MPEVDTTTRLSDETVILESTSGQPDCDGENCRYNPPPAKPQERYHFIRSIGFGGMKSVLLVYDSDTDREVAMAMMPDFRERPEADLQRFVREAKLTAHLEHPYIVPVHDIGTDRSGSPYFTMKYLKGMPLSTLLHRLYQGDKQTMSEYPLSRLLRLFTRICQAVEYAHAQGYCHLDLKPANVNVGEYGDTYILDWGLARAVDSKGVAVSEACAIRTGGTPGYMAPEQITSAPVGVKSDIYALGALLYTILSLKSPAADLSKDEVLQNTINGTFAMPSEIAPADRMVPASLEAVVKRAMAPDPADRYDSVRALWTEIIAFSSGFATIAEHASPMKRLLLFTWRNALWIAVGLLGAALALTLILLWMA